MVRPKTTTPVLTCDICGFRVSNPYIFKRHLHKCFTIHGIASNRSTSRHPIRLKGTEGLKSPDYTGSDQFQGSSDDLTGVQTSTDGNDNPNKDEMKESPQISGSFRDEEEGGSIGSVSSQWGVTNSPQVPIEVIVEKTEDGTISSVKVESPSPTHAKARFERKYSCESCPFQTLQSKSYLYHLRDEHGEKLNIYECDLCDYASRYNNKLSRHMAVHNKPGALAFHAFDPQIIPNQRLRVKPIKLKRLSVKTSPEFEISSSAASVNLAMKDSPTSTTNMISPDLSHPSPSTSMSMASLPSVKTKAFNQAKSVSSAKNSKPKQREVFKKVLAEDGSHRYQCRSCLFYTNSSFNVKKHHVLCHSKELHCSYCSFTTTEQAEYYEHILTHDGPGMKAFIKCEDCSYVTNARSNYEKHRSFHGADSPYHCTVCNFAADSESKVKRHMATQHINRTAGTDDDDDEGSFEEETMECEETVEKKFVTVEQVHIKEEKTMPSLAARGEKAAKNSYLLKYRCPQCPIVCLRRGNFTRHLIAKHQFTQKTASSTSKNLERKMLRSKIPPTPLQQPKMQVKKRPQLFFGGDNLKCSECSYTAKWRSDLRRHMQVHTIVKRFKCTLCNNKYKYSGDLNVHMRRDHLTEPQDIMAGNFVSSEVIKKASPALFRCPNCPYSTHSKADLEKHSKQHKDIEKTFRCRICDYQTYWRGDVGRHLFRHHSILLSKDPREVEKYFIHRPEIRPLTKQPQQHHYRPSLSPTKSVSEDGMNYGPLDLSRERESADMMDSPFGSVYKNPALVSGKEGHFACTHSGCDYRTTSAERLQSHQAYHENLKQFMCPTCGKRTNWKWDIVKHLHKVHKLPNATTDDVLTLSIEEARDTISDYLAHCERKTASISVYFCSLCDFKSGDKRRVLNHLEVNHRDEDGVVLSKSVPKSRSNIDLGMMAGENSLDSSISEGTNGDVFVDPPAEELAKVDKPFACAICKKAEISKAEVKKHYSYAHPYKDIRVVYTVDGTEFDYNTKLVYHSKLHLQERENRKTAGALLKTIKPDSKFSNPKMHGYVKPFKCSICGLRSNWKWDLKKHLRAKHPNHGGFVIMLSINEAKSTFALECSPSHPKGDNRQPTYKQEDEPAPSFKEVLFKQPKSMVKEEPYDANYGIFGKMKHSSREHGTSFNPNRRQWKCSGCSYISNWRRNMARHIQRHHAFDKDKIRVIALHSLSKDNQGRIENKQQDVTNYGREGGRSSFGSNGGLANLWHCSKCTFKSNFKTHIILHMQQHGMKPFSCGICEMPFMNRGTLHRHLQRIHKRSDYIKLCKVNLENTIVTASAEKVFVCCLCQMESKNKSVVIEHIADVHDVQDYEYYIVSMQRKESESFKASSPEKMGRTRKLHFCQLCPFRSQKKAMLVFHMTYHKPSAINRLKCKYCPYYVSTNRLLHQHQRKWHTENRLDNGTRAPVWDVAQSTPPTSPMKNIIWTEQIAGSYRRHVCGKCPYTTNSKNDFIYHKQFHRPKRTAEYKCEYCDYWVVHKRLLKQHMRLHTSEAPTSTEVSPVKSVYSDPGLSYDPVGLTELAALKQQMIAAKITPSLSKSPKFSPMKMATKISTDDKPGYILKNGVYRKVHKCRHCPYTNTRARNMQLHEMMHGPRTCSYPLMKCPYCDYFVGSKGLLSHHMKVHSKRYDDTPEKDSAMTTLSMADDDDGSDNEIQTQHKVDTLLSISRFKRFGCEKCPYASAKRQHFERHLELHGSRQRYTCQYCDYSVPSNLLLTQHSKLHLMPNQNLLASQSITSLQHMSEVPADVALASALPPTDRDMPVTISVIHDHLGLYENSIYDSEPKKLYRCDRCPYANIRRDYLLSHLKFHMVPSSLVCPYCDYSAPKQSLLIQHIRVHFCPLPELSDWLLQNGQTERETSQRNIDLAEALKVAHEYQNQSKKKSKGLKIDGQHKEGKEENTEEKENVEDGQAAICHQTLICQYCDREFSCPEKLVKHELQHLIGNQFEVALKTVSGDQQEKISVANKKVSKFDPPNSTPMIRDDVNFPTEETKSNETSDLPKDTTDNEEKIDSVKVTVDTKKSEDKLDVLSDTMDTKESEDKLDVLSDTMDTKKSEDKLDVLSDTMDTKESEDKLDVLSDTMDTKKSEDKLDVLSDTMDTKESEEKIDFSKDITDSEIKMDVPMDTMDTKGSEIKFDVPDDTTNTKDSEEKIDTPKDTAECEIETDLYKDITDAGESDSQRDLPKGTTECEEKLELPMDTTENQSNIDLPKVPTTPKDTTENIEDLDLSKESTESKDLDVPKDSVESKEDSAVLKDSVESKEDSAVLKDSVESKEDSAVLKDSVESKEDSAVLKDSVESKEDSAVLKDLVESKEDSAVLKDSVESKEDSAVLKDSVESKEDSAVLKDSVENKEDSAVLKDSVESKEDSAVLKDLVESKEDSAVLKDSVESKEDSAVLKDLVESKEDSAVLKDSVENKEDSAVLKNLVESKEDSAVLKESVENKEDSAVLKDSVESKEDSAVLKDSLENKEDSAVLKDSVESKEDSDLPKDSVESKEDSDLPKESAESKEDSDLPKDSVESKEDSDLPKDSVESKEDSDLPKESAESKEDSDLPKDSVESNEDSDLPKESAESREDSDLPKDSVESKEDSDLPKESEESKEDLKEGDGTNSLEKKSVAGDGDEEIEESMLEESFKLELSVDQMDESGSEDEIAMEEDAQERQTAASSQEEEGQKKGTLQKEESLTRSCEDAEGEKDGSKFDNGTELDSTRMNENVSMSEVNQEWASNDNGDERNIKGDGVQEAKKMLEDTRLHNHTNQFGQMPGEPNAPDGEKCIIEEKRKTDEALMKESNEKKSDGTEEISDVLGEIERLLENVEAEEKNEDDDGSVVPNSLEIGVEGEGHGEGIKEDEEKEKRVMDQVNEDEIKMNSVEEGCLSEDRNDVKGEENMEDGGMEDEGMKDEKMEGERMEGERMEGERMEDERMEDERMEDEGMENEGMKDEKMEGEKMEGERMEGERMEDEGMENEGMKDERMKGESGASMSDDTKQRETGPDNCDDIPMADKDSECTKDSSLDL